MDVPPAVTTSSEPEGHAPRSEGRIGLRGGRGIGFAEYGVAAGRTMFWFHGTPGGRHQVPPAARRFAAANDVRLIALERPGVGGSTPHLYDGLVDWADDVGEVAEQLGVGRFGLIGFSGGGPYALACAHRMPERVVASAVIGCVAPTCGSEAVSGGAVSLARRLSPLLEVVREPLGYALWALVRTLTPLSSQGFDAFIRIMPEGDQVVFRRPDIKRMFIDDLAQASRSGLHAPVYDVVLFARPWGFSLRDIRVPIRIWHGDSDNIVPLAHAEFLAQLLPNAKLRVRVREGHIGNLGAAEEILASVLSLWPAPVRLSG
jgi:pimeloyl-ACP methyl ester carboxylesterase